MKKFVKNWIDGIFLSMGMIFLILGVFLIYIPAGFISMGLCFAAMAFLIAKKQATRG
jgi:4-amino-4-deoxy-L-arabinose transferase-like glycosyltransferase